MRTQPGRLRWAGQGGVLDEDWLLGAERPDGAGQWRAQRPRMAVGTGRQAGDRAVGTGDRRCRSEAADQEGGGADGRGHRPAAPATHGDRRYLLSRGLDPDDLAPEPARLDALTRAAAVTAIPFPPGLAPRPLPVDPPPSPADRLPGADIVVITWTVDELAGLARILTPGGAGPLAALQPRLRHPPPPDPPDRPGRHSQRLGNYQLTEVGSARVLCVKSELHLNQDEPSRR